MMDAIVRSLREKCVTTPLKGEREREKEKTLLSPYCGVTFDRLCLKVF